MLALDSEVEVSGPNGARTIPMSEFTLAFYSTAIELNEIVTGVRMPLLAAGSAGCGSARQA